MARRIPKDRFRKLISAATEEFISQGYRRTQMEDVARRLGVAKGTLYGYVQSKDALFDAALRFADGLEPLPQHSGLPLETPRPGANANYLSQRIAEEAGQLVLAQAVSAVEDAGAFDLGLVLNDLYQRAYTHRFSIKLIDRCATDRPELAGIWFAEGRWRQHALLVEFLEREIRRGRVRPLPDAALTARLVLETIVFWAVHRHWDPAPQHLDEEQVAPVVINVILHGLAAGERS